MRLRLSDRFSTALILVSLALGVAVSGALARVDTLLSDLGQRLTGRAQPADVVIVAIDQNSLSKLGRWPWSRRLHATLIDRLSAAGARAIGLDLVFAEPSASDPPADALLAEAVARAGNVVLPVLIEAPRLNSPPRETLPLPQLLEGARGLGRAHVELDADGIARGIYLREGVGTPAWPHFAEALLQVGGQAPALPAGGATRAADPFGLVVEHYRRVRYFGPPGSVPAISYAQVLTGDFPPDAFRGKYVLVGATAVGMGDVLPTPVSGLGRPMPGVEIHANVLEDMRRGDLIDAAPVWTAWLVNALLALLPLLWLPRLTPLAGLVASAAALLVALGVALFLPLATWLPLSGGLLALTLAYPVWGWRRLEAASRFLDQELATLRTQLGRAAPARAERHDPFADRIAEVRAASEALEQLHETRAETLAFISHDLRAPLAQVLARVDPQQLDIVAPLQRAHALAEDFLHAARAEMLDPARFEPLDLASVAHQAADDAWSAAQARGVALRRRLPDTPCWIDGDFGLLHRALLNLLLNAVRHVSAGGLVEIVLDGDANGWRVAVVDDGPGVDPEDRARLFAPGATLAAGARAGGAGLGLYFVRTVAERHGGRVELDSEPGVRTVFALVLPVAELS